MKFAVICLTVAVICTTYAQELPDFDWSIKLCAVEDITCLRKSTEMFLNHSATGIQRHDIKPIDPLSIDTLSVETAYGFKLQFINVIITGLKNLLLNELKIDTKTKLVQLSTRVDLNIQSQANIELTDTHRTFDAEGTANASAIVTIKFNYEVKKDANDSQYFEIGPETIDCTHVNDPDVMIRMHMNQTMANEPEAKRAIDNYIFHKSEIEGELACKIIESAFARILNNLRKIAKSFLTESAFLTNV